jgi:hypothetical protein
MYGSNVEIRIISYICEHVRFDVFTAVTMKSAVFLDVAPCRYCVNRRFGGTYRLHLQGRKIHQQRISVAPIVFKITSLHGPHGKHCLLLLRLRVYSFVAWQYTSYSVRLLGADRIRNSFSYTVVTFLRGGGGFTGRRIERAVHLLLPAFVAVRMITEIPLLL